MAAFSLAFTLLWQRGTLKAKTPLGAITTQSGGIQHSPLLPWRQLLLGTSESGQQENRTQRRRLLQAEHAVPPRPVRMCHNTQRVVPHRSVEQQAGK